MTDPETTASAVALRHDAEVVLATASTRKAIAWRNQTMRIAELVARLAHTQRTHETVEEFHRMPKSDQDEIKDVGGFVGGMLKGGRRTRHSVASRSIITLDADHATPATLDTIRTALAGICHTIYSTHKHTPDKPRLRVLIYPDTALLPDQYGAVARKMAEKIGMDTCDDTTYEPQRLMYWPSTPSDGQYVFEHHDAPRLHAAEVLAGYGPDDAWRDVGLWPTSTREGAALRKQIDRQADPLTKPGIVGAWCRAVSIHEALREHLSDVYRLEATGRYTYLEGTSTHGVIVYDDRWVWSNHATDPARGHLCNAFDLIRVHRYGHLDDGAKLGTPTHKLPSYREMAQLATQHKAVRADWIRSAANDFADDLEPASLDDLRSPGAPTPEANQDRDWMSQLQVTAEGKVYASFLNAVILLEHDPELVGTVRYNLLENRMETGKGRPWASTESYRVRRHIDRTYDTDYPESKIEHALEHVANQHQYHPIRDYLNRLQWDGVERVDTLWIDWLRAEDNAYTRQTARRWLVAAVTRAFEPGAKFDYVPVLGGAQGIGKSTFVEILAAGWYGELLSFDEKLAVEAMQGRWLMELNELGATNRHDLEVQKQFLSARSNRVRMAYARHVMEFLRQCVFIGTTNETEYLRDSTGNRRWWPIDCGLAAGECVDFAALREAVPQIWAEAHYLYTMGETLLLEDDALQIASAAQEVKRETDEWSGIISEWVRQQAPVNRYDVIRLDGDTLEREARDRVCVMEIWQDCLDQPGSPRPFDRRRIGAVMNALPGWERVSSMRFGDRFGVQRGWRKPAGIDDDVPF